MKLSLRFCILLLPLTLIMLTILSAAQTTAAPTSTSQPQSDSHRGERLFNANCNRCHQAPDSLNPRITGTVIRHMRVRANLSAADEREILRFLNP